MNTVAYLTTMALLGIGLNLAQQNAKPSSDPSNFSNASAQEQSGPSTAGASEQAPSGAPNHHHRDRKQSSVPDATVRDQQSSTTSTTGISGQDNAQPSTSTMGTTGSTPGSSDQPPQGNTGAATPQTGTPPDQQPNFSPTPQATLIQGPAARAVATHSPDPGTCMDPAALEIAHASDQPPASPPCR